MVLQAVLTDVLVQPRDDVYGPYDHSYLQTSGPKQHTTSPSVTGTSVVAMKFNGGVVIAADNLGASHLMKSQNSSLMGHHSFVRILGSIHRRGATPATGYPHRYRRIRRHQRHAVFVRATIREPPHLGGISERRTPFAGQAYLQLPEQAHVWSEEQI
jgi:hypothetical protein